MKQISNRGRNMVEFGIFLLDRGRIDAEQLAEALRKQLINKLPIGQLAIEKKILSIKQVFGILGEQSDSKQMFGEIAITKGWLTKSQLAGLLMEQSERTLDLSAIFVQLEVLTQRVMNEEIIAFQKLSQKKKGFQEEASLCSTKRITASV